MVRTVCYTLSMLLLCAASYLGVSGLLLTPEATAPRPPFAAPGDQPGNSPPEAAASGSQTPPLTAEQPPAPAEPPAAPVLAEPRAPAMAAQATSPEAVPESVAVAQNPAPEAPQAVEPLAKPLLLVSLPVGALLVDGHDTLSDEEKAMVAQAAEKIRLHESATVEVRGHSDNIPLGKALARQYKDNAGLSEKRAMVAADELVADGIDRQRIKVRGLGSSQPIASNETYAGRKANRRVEIWLVPETRAPGGGE